MTTQTSVISHDVPALIKLLEKQCQLYEQLASLSEQQTGIIAADLAGNDSTAAGQLLGLLAQRQRLIDQIAVTNKELVPYRADWTALWRDLGSQDRCRIGPMVDRLEQLLAGIIKQDDQDQQTLKQTQTRVGGELKRLATAGDAVNACKTAPAPNQLNRFTNQQG